MKKRISLVITLFLCTMICLTACDISEIFGKNSTLITDTTLNLTDILKNRPNTVSYDVSGTYLSSNSELHIEGSCWMTKDNTRIETQIKNFPIVLLQNYTESTQYAYSQTFNIAFKSDFNLNDYSYNAWLDKIDPEKSTVIGEQYINGKQCIVIIYTENNKVWTVWLYKDVCFPIKIVCNDTTIVEFKNISINKKIDNNIFAVPDNAKIIDITINDDITKLLGELEKLSQQINLDKIKDYLIDLLPSNDIYSNQ